nr:glutamine amidotransferase [uncultured Merdimonas sp.]
MKKVLLAGESWISYTRHIKGFDSFFTSTYEEGIQWIQKSIEKAGYELCYISNTYAAEKFPRTLEELQEYDAVILSDIGSNTLLITNQCFTGGKQDANRCRLIKEYVEQGGGFCMIGGYMSFTGIDAKARYGQTEIADILPVKMLDIDDRVEAPQGIHPVVVADHAITKGLKDVNWPYLLGYNKTVMKPEGQLLATIEGDPLIAAAEYGKGRSAVFTSDCSPHWGSPAFVEWDKYDDIWGNMLNWLTKKNR